MLNEYYTKSEIDKLMNLQLCVNQGLITLNKCQSARIEKLERSLQNVYEEIDSSEAFEDSPDFSGIDFGRKRFKL